MPISKLYRIKTGHFVCGVEVENTIIKDTAPILKKFKGQSIDNLKEWLKLKFPKYEMKEIKK